MDLEGEKNENVELAENAGYLDYMIEQGQKEYLLFHEQFSLLPFTAQSKISMTLKKRPSWNMVCKRENGTDQHFPPLPKIFSLISSILNHLIFYLEMLLICTILKKKKNQGLLR